MLKHFICFLLQKTVVSKARYAQKSSRVKQQSKKSKGAKMKLTLKERRGLIINKAIDKLAKGLATVNPNVGWRNLSSTKLRAKKK